jgi:hypothetical protein
MASDTFFQDRSTVAGGVGGAAENGADDTLARQADLPWTVECGAMD